MDFFGLCSLTNIGSKMSKIKWSSEKRKITDLIPTPNNPRQMNEKQAKDLTTSLDKFSLAEPIVINLNNSIVGGHQRVNILKSKGIEEVDVRVPDRLLTEEEELELVLRLNKNNAGWDWDGLANLDKDLLLNVGFEPEELAFRFEADPLDTGADKEEKEKCITCGRAFPNSKNILKSWATLTYHQRHARIRRVYKNEQKKCESCGTEDAEYYDWANISLEYKEERSDWKRLCRPCHGEMDSTKRNHKRSRISVKSKVNKIKMKEEVNATKS